MNLQLLLWLWLLLLLVAPGLASYCNAFLFNRIFDKYGMTLE